MIEVNGTPDTYIAGMMDAARIVRERKGKYTLEQTAKHLEDLCLSQGSQDDPPSVLASRIDAIRNAWAETDISFKSDLCDEYRTLHDALKAIELPVAACCESPTMGTCDADYDPHIHVFTGLHIWNGYCVNWRHECSKETKA